MSVRGARDTYGVIADGSGVDEDATRLAREGLRRQRSDDATADVAIVARRHDVTLGRRIDDNLVEVSVDGQAVVACRHCGQHLGDAGSGPLLALARRDAPSSSAGPQVTSDPVAYVDDPVVFRQYCCPGCWTALYSSIVPTDHVDHVADLSRLLPAAGPDRE